MSRASFHIKIDGKTFKLRLHHEDPFPDYMGGYLRHYDKGWPNHDSTALIHISELTQINSLAVGVLRDRGYDLDGVRACFQLYDFWGYENPQAVICGDLGDEYKWEPDEPNGLYGRIKRALPRFSIDPLPLVGR